ncbi:hypothetical protein [Streptomyces sp. H27-C3]|uniref:hypothetical protein n=1 Tax=Streptomyces sp. H27-C3 TaxID=3046305 RepID=UPI0024BA829F|nr:hypothetical protein [Streptomyces sp. H27-C3]MDJ0461580.1 hypothetical protein [Streptomyces sp. H27-C3]
MTTCLLCERPSEDGYLCLLCTKDLRVRLESLPGLYAGLLPFLTPAATGGQGRGSKPVYAPLPVAEDVLDLRGPGGLVGVAERWLVIVREERGVAKQDGHPMGTIEGRLHCATHALVGHLPWVAVSWPDAGVFAEDIRAVTESVRSIVDPREAVERGTRLGSCAALLGDGTSCGAVLRLMPDEKAARCLWCATIWPPCTWLQLKAWQDEDTKVRDVA